MSEEIKVSRLGKAAKEFNVSTATIVEFLSKKGFTVEDSINTKLTEDIYHLLMIEYQREKQVREEALKLEIGKSLRHTADEKNTEGKTEKPKTEQVQQVQKVQKTKPVEQVQEVEKIEKAAKKSSEKPKTEKEEAKEVVKEKVKAVKEKTKTVKEKIKEVKEIKETEPAKEIVAEVVAENPVQEKKEEKQEEIIAEIPKNVEVIEIPKEEKAEFAQTEIEAVRETEKEVFVPEIPQAKEAEPEASKQEMEQRLEMEELHLLPKVVGKVDLSSLNTKLRPARKTKLQLQNDSLEREKKEKEKLEREKKEKLEKERKQKDESPQEKKEDEPSDRKEKRRIRERERKKAYRERKRLEKENQRLEQQKEAEKAAKMRLELLKKEANKPKAPPPIKKEPEMIKAEVPSLKAPKVIGVLDLSSINERTKPKKKTKEQLRKEKDERLRKEKEERKAQRDARRKSQKERDNDRKPTDKDPQKFDRNKKQEKGNNFMPTRVDKLSGLKVVDKISIPSDRKDAKSNNNASNDDRKEKRKRFKTTTTDNKFSGGGGNQKGNLNNQRKDFKKDTDRRVKNSEEEVDLQIKKTMARMAPTGKTKSSKYRREKRDLIHQNIEQAQERQAQEKNILKVTEYITASELATMMNVPVNKVIATCMSVGLMVAINQRLDTENIQLLAEEFGYQVQFVGVEEEENKQEEVSNPEDLESRPPIVTIMGHVDHGKTSLLDYIRKTNVIAGEAGGITQHIGAYEVELPDKRRITFLDTPGHEAFTAMRARGAKVTDIVIVVIAADDSIMPQTVEAINHAHAAGVPIIFAINKIDKPGADPEKIRTALANMNLLVEEWGGKIQSQDISAKKGINVDVLMEKILIEAEMLELKANPKLSASGTIIESSLDKGRGYVAKALIQNGTLYKGDVVVAGTSFGKIKAMYNERNHLLASAGPASPVLLLGLDSAPQAGDTFKVYESEKEAKSIVGKRQQLIREQGLRTQKHITLTEIGRRIAIGDFKELNIIVKGDVDGSIEALSDSLLRLTTEEVQVNVIHKSVGQVTESDILLASASNAIIIAFQVRPSASARKLAEQEQIDIRTYSIIYDAINDLKEAIEGMKAPEIKETIVCNIEVREVFRITKVGVIAGCYVLDGKVQRSTQIRVIRDGIVVFTGRLGSLKRFKDDVKEVTANYECGLNIESYNDIKVGDIIEGFEQVAVKR